MIQRMRFGFWMPVFGGWLRNVEDEGMPATFAYQRELAQQADRDGWDVTLIAELNLNDIKGPEADCLEAWTTAAALAPLTERLELMAAVRPNFRLPALVAKEAATIDRISNGRFTLNVVSAWWETEARQYGATWIEHDERYARTEGEASRASAAPVRCRRIRHRSQQRRRRKEGARPDNRCTRERPRLCELSGLHQGFAVGDQGIARGLQRFEPRPAHRPRRHAGSGGGPSACPGAHRH